MVYKITAGNFEQEVEKSDMPVLVDFWAAWCGPCQMMGPVVDEIAGERPDIKVGKVNVTEQQELAAAFHAQRAMGLKGGMLVATPIPDASAMDADVISSAINQAVAESREQGIHGKATTPFLLARVKDLTGGDSLESNIQLVFNNARVAAKAAAELARLG